MCRVCKICLVHKPHEEFAPGPMYKGRRTYRYLCKPCTYRQKVYRISPLARKVEVELFVLFGKDVIYDYRFARHAINLTHEYALLWLYRGYPKIPMEVFESWKLRDYEAIAWVPDEIEES